MRQALKAVLFWRDRVSPAPRLLEDGTPRVLEDGTHRLLEA